MSQVVIKGEQGIPFRVYNRVDYKSWLIKQSQVVQNWINTTDPEAKGLLVIPDFETGQIAQTVLFCDDINQFWACGDLNAMLPEGDYLLTNENEVNKLTAISFALGAYTFAPYKNVAGSKTRIVISDDALYQEIITYVKGISLVRDLVNTPAGDMMPQHLAEVMQDLATEFSADFTQIIGDELLEQNYPTIHAVGRASANKPRLLDLRWGDKTKPQVTLVGKGVCFDSGGLDLKPAAGMRLMKKDMGGAAHVLGLAYMVMALKLPINLRVLIPAVENAVSDNALRPGDVIKTRKGLTVEIDNTDAEGRLVLCDALAEAENDNPDTLIDFATLTGACRVALGTELPGFFCNDKVMADAIEAAAVQCQDPVWQLPLHRPYKDLLKSDIADMTNCASGPFGGAITAALYLEEFVNPSTSWVHYDVMAWNIRKLPGRPLGGEAFGVRAMLQFLVNKYQ